METVKVDMQKLQLLNDRIAQTIEALNQLRLSVHGIQHTSQINPWGGYPMAYGQSVFGGGVYGQPAFVNPTFSQGGFGQPTFVNPYSPSFSGFGGLSHSTWEPHWQPQWQTRAVPTWIPTTPTYPVSIY